MWKRNEFGDSEADGRVVYGDGWFCSDDCYHDDFLNEQQMGHHKLLSTIPQNGIVCATPGCGKIFHRLDMVMDLTHVEKYNGIDYFSTEVDGHDLVFCADGLFAVLNRPSFDPKWDQGQNISIRIRPAEILPEGTDPNIELDSDGWHDFIWRFPGEKREGFLEQETSDSLEKLGFVPGLYLVEVVK